MIFLGWGKISNNDIYFPLVKHIHGSLPDNYVLWKTKDHTEKNELFFPSSPKTKSYWDNMYSDG